MSGKTVYEQMQEDHPLDMAAAHACLDALMVMEQACEKSFVTSDDAATVLGITPERFDEIIFGDGNVRVTTLARVLRMAGYDLRINLVRNDRSAPIDELRSKRYLEHIGLGDGSSTKTSPKPDTQPPEV